MKINQNKSIKKEIKELKQKIEQLKKNNLTQKQELNLQGNEKTWKITN